MTILGFLVSIAGLILSYSRASILILGGLLLVFLLFRLNQRIHIVIVSLVLVIVASVLSFKFGSGLIYQEIKAPFNQQWLIDNSPEKRIFIWPIILEFISQRPILGYGLENLRVAFSKYERFHEQRDPVYFGIKNLIIDRSHNYSLDLLFSSGFLGFLIWIFLVVILLKKARGILLLSLIIYLVWIQLQVQGIVHLMYFWLLGGLVDQDGS